jgi:hypothetical protein
MFHFYVYKLKVGILTVGILTYRQGLHWQSHTYKTRSTVPTSNQINTGNTYMNLRVSICPFSKKTFFCLHTYLSFISCKNYIHTYFVKRLWLHIVAIKMSCRILCIYKHCNWLICRNGRKIFLAIKKYYHTLALTSCSETNVLKTIAYDFRYF